MNHSLGDPTSHRLASLTYRRWSAAVADIPDDNDFLRELDRRLELGGASSIGMHDIGDNSTDEAGEPGSSGSSGRWAATRRAMLCVREIIRTEKSYLDHLIRCNEMRVSDPIRTLSVRLQLSPFLDH